MDKLNNSVRTSKVEADDFVALFVPGGHGSPPEPASSVSAMPAWAYSDPVHL